MPIGSIIWYPRSTPPDGWLVCNGQSTAAYSALAAIVGSTVPDLRGEFIRGWDAGKGVDPGRIIGSLQDASTSGSLYQVQQTWQFGASNLITVPENGTWSDAVLVSTTNTNGALKFSSRTVQGGTRPQNIALLPCIKY